MNEVLGCGIDIEELIRFKKHIPSKTGIPGFLQLVYSDAEINCNLNILPHLTFPIGFSCKEACFKAFGVSWTNSRISWKDIEIIFSNEHDLQEYSIRLSGYALELFDEKKCSKIESYLEYTDEYVIFQVILLS
jgi:phosphopantetheine--protein transferase-like protein